jgi:hypothetical protein
MTDTTSGAPVAITLDGIHLLEISPQEIVIREEERVTHRQGAAGNSRESRPWVEPGEPGRAVKIGVTLDWQTVRAKAPLIDRLLALPGAHRLAVWKRVTTAHESDGAGQVVTLPRAFVQDALDHQGLAILPPGGHPWSRFATHVYLAGPLGAAIEPELVSQATWDAGDPAAGVVWRLTGEPLLKLAAEDVPVPGQYVNVEMVPELRVHRVAPGEVSYRSPIPEPRRLELREV